MRIGVVATGAVGGYFGARLAHAGHDVFFLARGANLEAIRKSGLQVRSVIGDVHVRDPNVTDDPGEIGPVDIVLFAVKLWDTEQAARQARPLVQADTRVIPLQNGIDSPDILAPIFGEEMVTPGIAYIAAVLSEPGVVMHTSQFAQIVTGNRKGIRDPLLEAFVDEAQRAGIDISMSDDIERERWQKFAFLVGLSGATASTRLPVGPILEDPGTRKFIHGLINEVVLVGQAKGIPIQADFADDRLEFLDTSPPTLKASMLHDLERGNRLELDWLSGRVAQLGHELGIPTPKNDAVYNILKLHRAGAVS
jgi:2-dehydropantoate 2-reductase